MVIAEMMITEEVLSQSFSYIPNPEYFSPRVIKSERRAWERSSAIKSELRSNSPVGLWLSDLRQCPEVESLSALQAKSVATGSASFEALSIRNAQISVQSIRRSSVGVLEGLDQLIDRLPVAHHGLPDFHDSFAHLCAQLCAVVEDCRRRGPDQPADKASVAVSSLCQSMLRFLNDFQYSGRVNNAQLEASLRKLKERLGELVDLTIKKDCRVISDALQSTRSLLCLKWSLLALWQLTQNDAYACRIFSTRPSCSSSTRPRDSVVGRLLAIACAPRAPATAGRHPRNGRKSRRLHSIASVEDQLKAASLRVLTHLSTNSSAVLEMYRLLDFQRDLIDGLRPDADPMVLRELVGFIVQLSTPFIDHRRASNDEDVDDEGQALGAHIRRVPLFSLAACLTEVARCTSSRDIFLLVAAGLANLSFISTEAVLQADAVRALIAGSKRRLGFGNLPVKDQMLTVLANVSKDYPLEVMNSGGLVFLLCALQLRPGRSSARGQVEPSGGESSSSSSVERIQQKVATALARLAVVKTGAKLIHRLNGVERLVELCKDGQERNFSDTVLLACLAALRRIVSVVGRSAFKKMDALDLVDLDFRESYVLYTSRNESYV